MNVPKKKGETRLVERDLRQARPTKKMALQQHLEVCAAACVRRAAEQEKLVMTHFFETTIAAVVVAIWALFGCAQAALAQDGAIDQTTAAAFDARLFAAVPGYAPGKKTYACFVRHYDADHLARHPKQKVSAMLLLVTAEIPPDEKVLNYSFRLGVSYRQRPGDFDSSGYCSHARATGAGQETGKETSKETSKETGKETGQEIGQEIGKEIRFDCSVDCEGGGIGIAMSKDDQSAIIRLERITIWQRNKPDAEAGDALLAGADDKIFRLDRAEVRDCAALVTNRKELAAIRHK